MASCAFGLRCDIDKGFWTRERHQTRVVGSTGFTAGVGYSVFHDRPVGRTLSMYYSNEEQSCLSY